MRCVDCSNVVNPRKSTLHERIGINNQKRINEPESSEIR